MNKLSRRVWVRRFTAASVTGVGTTLLPVTSSADTTVPAPALTAAAESDLIYLAALKADGAEGQCQAEVWFVPMAGGFVIVTAADSWRVAWAQRQQLVKVWVGDVGQWQESAGGYRKLPALTARSSVVADSARQAEALDLLGKKYRMSWVVWGPRFRNGLADGSRVMLNYQPVA